MSDAEQLAARLRSAVECGPALSQLKDAAWTVSRGHAETQVSQRRRADRGPSAARECREREDSGLGLRTWSDGVGTRPATQSRGLPRLTETQNGDIDAADVVNSLPSARAIRRACRLRLERACSGAGIVGARMRAVVTTAKVRGRASRQLPEHTRGHVERPSRPGETQATTQRRETEQAICGPARRAELHRVP